MLLLYSDDVVRPNCNRSRSACDGPQELVASTSSTPRPAGPCANQCISPLQILETALEHEQVDIHESQTDKAAALQTLAQNVVIFARGPDVKVG